MSAGLRAVQAASAAAVLLAAHTAVNAALLRRPAGAPPPVAERVSVLLPVRDEAHQVGGALAAVLASTGVPDLEVLVLDDGSADGTAAAARDAAAGDPRVQVLAGAPLAAGWLGKPHALAQLAHAATGSVLVCLDADVRLAPRGLAATVDLLRRHGLALVSPYPRQVAVTPAERLVQPLLQWSWLATLPLRLAERSPRPSLSAANGQLMALDAAALERAGGFAAVRAEVLDDVALVRAVKAAGGRGGVADGTALATCRMYDGWPALRDGYAKSLWSATGSPAGAAALVAALAAVFVLPPAAALTGLGGRAGRWAGLAGCAAGVASRAVAARRTGGRAWPDALAHPVSVGVLCALVVRSWRLRRTGGLAWKGRALP
ncbi:glycosyltransferase [Quadrisphaera sp. KR29]|uniref:glycosyltransferase n=1 Tax=Quadrisphaera sp. KR29 TaxID=3461391 RepID=UPI004044C6FE